MCWGLDATYTLDQISNKYSSAARGNGKTITSCDLHGTPVVNSYVPQGWLPWILDKFYTEEPASSARRTTCRWSTARCTAS
ncbi:MAG: hypothetical protein WDN08_06650 [Rhizomicrobium sp.]